MLTYSEVDLAASHHIVQEGVLSRQLQTHTQTQRHLCVKQLTIHDVTHIRH